jgi:hypothetical protein
MVSRNPDSRRRGNRRLNTTEPYTGSDIRADAVKPIAFKWTSLDDLRAFPSKARREAGHQLDRVQRGLEPNDWKPMPSV